ncbi:MAG: endonuclease/exonuclease/phosphatase family protein [Bacteroidota bacterium]
MIKRIFFSALLLISIHAYSQQLNIGTYNLRYANSSDSSKGNGWGQRYPVIAQIIRFNDLDIFGTQEGLYPMLNNLNDSLPGYKWLGVGRDGGEKGEHSAIFYKTAKFKVLKSGSFWLSPTDTEKPNVGWDAALTRVCTWAQFREIKTGYVFNFFNVHMDHVGVVARRESAKLIMSRMKQMTGSIPTILTGDFNTDQNSDAYQTLNNSGLLKDCFTLAPIKLATNNTFNDFKVDNKDTGARIDHIFVTRHFKPLRYAILTNTYRGKLPSDHYPVVVTLSR